MKFSAIICLIASVSAVQWHGPERKKVPFPTPSKIVKGEIPNGVGPISPSAFGENSGPTYDYKFSDDKVGAHKVEVFKHMTQ